MAGSALKTNTQKTFRLGLGIFLLAFGVRLIYLFEQSVHNPLFDYPVVDAVIYSSWADEIVRGQWWWPELRNYLPVYPWFLAICKWFFYGDLAWSVKVIQSLLGAAAAGMLAVVTRQLFGRVAGVAAGLLLACNWLFIVYDGERYAESLCLFGLVLCLYQLFCAAPGWSRTLLAGASCALACGCRPNLLPLIPLVAFWIFWAEWALTRRLLHAAAIFILSAMIFVPVLWHNHQLSGKWMLRAQQNWNLYAALNPEFGGLHPAGGIAFDKWMKEPVLAGCTSHADQDVYWRQKAGQLLQEHPWEVARNFLLERGAIFMDATEWSQEFDVYAFRNDSPVLRLPCWPGFGWIFPLACVGLMGMWARRCKRGTMADKIADDLTRSREVREELQLLRAFAPSRETEVDSRDARRILLAGLLIAIAFTFLFKVTGRYRFPVTLFLTPFAGAGAAVLWQMLIEKRWRHLLLPVAIFCAAGVISWPDWADLQHRQTAMHEFYMGQKYRTAGKLPEAEAALREAMRKQPQNADVPCELARVLGQEQRMTEALQVVSEAIRLEPEFWRAWNLKGSLAAEQKQYDLALRCIEQSLKIMPQQPEPWMLKAEVCAKTGSWLEENDACQKAIEHGAVGEFQLAYGLRLAEKALYAEARQQYEAVANDQAQARFDRARAQMLTGYVLALKLQRLDEARRCWKDVATAYADQTFFADQALFLSGTIDQANYRSRVEELKIPTAAEYYDFNRGVVALLRNDAGQAEKGFRACLERGGISPDATEAPVALPQKWAWEQLRKLRGQ